MERQMIPAEVRSAFEKFVAYETDKPTQDGTEQYTSHARLGHQTRLYRVFENLAKEAGLDPKEIAKQLSVEMARK